MAAPSGTVWGSIIGGYGRIGIYTELTHTTTETSASVEVWFWSKYSIDDSSNHLYYDLLASAGSATTSQGMKQITTNVESGSGWDTRNQVKIFSRQHTFSRKTTAYKRYVYAKLEYVDRVGGTMYASTTFDVPALPSYAINYNANGGSGAPGTQAKQHGSSVTLSTTKPTRAGYTFQGWATSASGSVAYQPGATYTANAAVTLYAVWEPNTYTVSYNANGGTGAPASQTKKYGVVLTLSSTKPTRTNYTFKGWATSAAATTATYSAGGSYTANNAATLYAVWELAYVSPAIYNLTASRCDSNGTETDDGTCGLIKFSWKCILDVSSITIAWSSTAGNGSATVTASGTSGSVSQVIGNSALSTDASYTIRVSVADSGGDNDATTTLSGNVYPLDLLAGGKGIGFGKPAERGAEESLGGKGVADFAFDARFNQPVYGKALGMDKVPEIPAYSDLNDYREPGCYAVYSNSVASTIGNIPVTARAGRLEVWSATGEGVRLEQYSYLRQRYVPYNSTSGVNTSINAVWERDITRGAENNWTFSEWWRSSLTPEESKKVYHKQKFLWGLDKSNGMYMTADHTATLTEKISEQPNGIVLVFCYYNGTSDTNWGWIARFVPKILVQMEHGEGHTFELTNGKFGSVGTKYLYINDDSIVGHADNNLTGTSGSGITYANNRFVLRYVIGV